MLSFSTQNRNNFFCFKIWHTGSGQSGCWLKCWVLNYPTGQMPKSEEAGMYYWQNLISKLNLILLQSMACSFKRLNKDRYAAKTVVYYTHFTHVLFNSSVHKKNPHQFSYDVASALVWRPINVPLLTLVHSNYHNTKL